MKPIFGVDKTTKTNNSEQFIVDSISEGFSFEDIMINPPEDSAKTKLFKKLKIVLACIAIPLTMLVCFAGIKEINWLMLTAFIVLLPFIGVFLYLTFSVEASDNSKNNETYEYLLLAQQEVKMVDNKIEAAIKGEVDKCLRKGKWIEDYYNRILISMIAILFVIFLIVFFVFKSKISLTEGIFGLIIAIADVIIGGILTVIINAFKEYYTNSERLYTKYRRKLMKKYKALL